MRRRERLARHAGPPSLWKAPAIAAVPFIAGIALVLSGLERLLVADGVEDGAVGVVLLLVGGALIVALGLYWSGFWWRRKRNS